MSSWRTPREAWVRLTSHAGRFYLLLPLFLAAFLFLLSQAGMFRLSNGLFYDIATRYSPPAEPRVLVVEPLAGSNVSAAQWVQAARRLHALGAQRVVFSFDPFQASASSLGSLPFAVVGRRAEAVPGRPHLWRLLAALRARNVPEADAIERHYRTVSEQLREYEVLEKMVAAGGNSVGIDRCFTEQLWRWFRQKIVVIDNFYATGEEIVERLVEITPPGFRNRIMGMQNIKGTGLDFAYRWHAWEACYKACADAMSTDAARVSQGVRVLSTFQGYGVLSDEYVRGVLAELRSRTELSGEVFRAQLELITIKLDEQLHNLRSGRASSTAQGLQGKFIHAVESLLDPGDAVRRRRRAEVIYQDIADERISSERAVLELQKLNSRQKGGWLAGELKSGTHLASKAMNLSKRPETSGER